MLEREQLARWQRPTIRQSPRLPVATEAREEVMQAKKKKIAKRGKHLRVPVSPEEEAAIKQLATNGRSVAATCATSDLDIEWKAFSITGGLKN